MQRLILAFVFISLSAGVWGCDCAHGTEKASMVSLGGRSYHFHTETRMSWFDAYSWCRHHRMQLVSIENELQNRLLQRAISGSNDVFWTSGTDLEVEGRWMWHSSGLPFNYTGWRNGEPNNFNDQDHCMFVGYYAGSSSNEWHDACCMAKHHFICEKME